MPKEMDLGLSYESLESSSSDSEVEQCKKDKKLKAKSKSTLEASSNSVGNTSSSSSTNSDSESPEEKGEEEEKTKVCLTSKLRRVWEEKCQLYSSRMDKLSKVFKSKNGVFSYSAELWDKNWEYLGNEEEMKK